MKDTLVAVTAAVLMSALLMWAMLETVREQTKQAQIIANACRGDK